MLNNANQHGVVSFFLTTHKQTRKQSNTIPHVQRKTQACLKNTKRIVKVGNYRKRGRKINMLLTIRLSADKLKACNRRFWRAAALFCDLTIEFNVNHTTRWCCCGVVCALIVKHKRVQRDDLASNGRKGQIKGYLSLVMILMLIAS